jgi:hypothetical protein
MTHLIVGVAGGFLQEAAPAAECGFSTIACGRTDIREQGLAPTPSRMFDKKDPHMKTLFARTTLAVALMGLSLLTACTQEQQNKISRDIQNWTGTNGVMEVYAGDKVVRRFLKVDKVSTALGTDDGKPRAYRYGYGVLDENLNMVADPGEKKVYFEVSDYSNTVFFENPR